MKTTSFKQSVTLKASPSDVYDTLMDSKSHALFTGGAARISKKEGGSFTVFDGYVSGKNLELIPGKKIVQSWKPVEDDWPDDHFSEVIFELEKIAGGKCRIAFTHNNIPSAVAGRFKQGWKDYYWNPLKELFG